MGLFSRTNQDNADQDNNESEGIFDRVELPNSEDINEEYIENSEKLDFNQAPPLTEPPKSAYSIEDAIKLMQSLPKDNNEMVVSVVKKTLESTNIDVKDIVGEADRKESRINQQQEKLESEIEQLEEKIRERNQRISTLKEDLKVTVNVRERLQLAITLDRKNEQPGKTASKTENTANPAKNQKSAAASNNIDSRKSADRNPATANTAAQGRHAPGKDSTPSPKPTPDNSRRPVST